MMLRETTRILCALVLALAATFFTRTAPAQTVNLQTQHTFAVLRMPFAEMIKGSDGDFYGTTYNGGKEDLGAVYKLTASGEITLLHSFSGPDGSHPSSCLAEGNDGAFYGTTSGGGINYNGTVFKITPNGIFTTLHYFNYPGGRVPCAGLVLADDGCFYGTTSDPGTVFKITPDGLLTTLHTFDSNAHPKTALIQGLDGALYGTIDYGSIFRITPEGTLTTLYNFSGLMIKSPLTQGLDGAFYGTAFGLPTSFNGIVFRLTPEGVMTTIHTFNGADGSFPQGALVQDSAGALYGTTWGGGRNGAGQGYGTVFKVTPGGVFTLLHMFDGTDGGFPYAGLVQ
ncbi:MAG: hypothetical protein H8M99_01200, partial [Gloeobacteraceae cyanobacterium ES-bin-144]|nr:hypothetical protein [Verrucomicrobiales bacterium]